MIKERGMKMEGRKYYAHSCLWGANAVQCNNIWKYWGEYYAFSSKAARDAWVNENYLSRDKASVVARACTRAEVVSQLGNNFHLLAGCEACDYSETEPELLCSRD